MDLVNGREWIDATRSVRAGMPVWPGDPPVEMEWAARIDGGDPANLARFTLGMHVGTHADAPLHALRDGARVAELPLETFMGPARLVDASARDALDAEWLRRVLDDEVPERLLVRTGCWRTADGFPTDFPALDADAARVLTGAGVRLFGTDAPSVEAFGTENLAAHRVLLEGGVGVLESLLLDGLPEGPYDLLALPLRLDEADGSPVRALLRPRA